MGKTELNEFANKENEKYIGEIHNTLKRRSKHLCTNE